MRRKSPWKVLLLFLPFWSAASSESNYGHLRGVSRDGAGEDPFKSVRTTKNTSRIRNLSEPTCVGSSLQPSQQLLSNQFLCRGQQRFGILDGRLILGLSSGSAKGKDEQDDLFDAVSPTHIAWQAAPTTLFVECSRSFHSLLLSSNGSLLGVDAQGIVIYDSNLDYGNRLESKVSNSVLGFSTSCGSMNVVGELCLKLTSPPGPSLPWGLVTWGVALSIDSLMSINASQNDPSDDFVTLSLTDDSINAFDVTSTTISPSIESLLNTPTFLPTSSPIVNSQSIIYGSVWLDSDANGSMNVGEKPVAGVSVELYECIKDANNTITTLVDTKLTDSKGWYFFQVPIGSYKVHFDVLDLQVYKFTHGGDFNILTGWTDCATPTSDQPIQWNAGLNNVVTSDRDPIVADMQPQPAIANSKLGGAVFMDLNGNGRMDSAESDAVENGYTVPDAMVRVSIHDCDTNIMKQSSKVAFPGTYMFNNLTEGLYKVEFDIISLKSNNQNMESRLPLYSFYDKKDGSSSFETNCIQLRRNDANTSVHAGIRPPKLKVTTKLSEDYLFGQMEATLAEEDKEVKIQSAGLEEKDPPKGRLVVGSFAGVAVVVASAVMFIYKQQHSKKMASNLIVNSDTDNDLSTESPKDSVSPVDEDVAVVKTPERDDNVLDENDDDHTTSSADYSENSVVQLDKELQGNPYQRYVPSILETESLDSDPYIFTSDEQESLGSDPHVYTTSSGADYGYPQQISSEGMYCEESSVVSNRSSDPPAASYKDIPLTSHVYHDNHHPSYGPPVAQNDQVPHISHRDSDNLMLAVNDYQNEWASIEEPNDFPFESSDSSFSYEDSESSHSRSSLSPNADSRPKFANSYQTQDTDNQQQGGRILHLNTMDADSTIPPYPNHYIGTIVDDQSVYSAQSDHSTDPPGASYQVVAPQRRTYRGNCIPRQYT